MRKKKKNPETIGNETEGYAKQSRGNGKKELIYRREGG